MKEEQNNEMDVLLRNLRRTASASFKVDGREEEHLDADELNAYAEKVLPAAAHARYTNHIADCARWRKIAADLGVAAGVITEEKVEKPVLAPTGFKAFLTSLFSPMVLRYSVPALALLMVAMVGWVALRRSNNPFVAVRSARTNGAEDAGAKKETREQLKQEPASLDSLNAPSAASPSSKSRDSKPETPKEEKAGSDDSRKAKDAKNDQPITATDQVAAAAPGSAASANAAEPPPPAKRAVAQEPEAGRAAPVVVAPAETVSISKSNEKQAEKEAKSSQPTVFGAMSGPNKAKSEVTRTRGRGDAAPRDEDTVKRRESDDKDEEAPETRSVAGRRFRKDGSVWIDTAYNGQATTNVSRGSEQYRALIADEPGIKTIAAQFDGAVIIMWKGRAYKIK